MKNNINKTLSKISMCFAALCLSAVLAYSAAPGYIAYQGKLTNTAGNPVPNAVNNEVTFRIFGAPTGGTALQTQTVTNITTVNGVFSVLIPVDPVHFQNGIERYLEVTYAENAFSPRQRLVAAPYALAVAADAVGTTEIQNNAVTAGKIIDGAVGNAKLANNAVTEEKISNNSVTKAKINGSDKVAIYKDDTTGALYIDSGADRSLVGHLIAD